MQATRTRNPTSKIKSFILIKMDKLFKDSETIKLLKMECSEKENKYSKENEIEKLKRILM